MIFQDAGRSTGRKVALGVLLLALSGCTSFHAQPIVPEHTAAQLQQRSLDNPSLLKFVDSNRPGNSGEVLPSTWDLDALTLAALYLHPELEVARAQWAAAEAARVTAGERPDLTASLVPGKNTTTTTPSPTLVTATVDLTLETAGKRGYRIAMARELAEAARLNVASVAWQVYSRVRSSLLALYGAVETETLLRQQQTIHASNVQVLEGQFRAGAISAFELTQARLAADGARLALRDAERREAEARAQLAGAVGVPVATLDGVTFSFAQFEELPAGLDAPEVRQQALLNRADILSALAEYAASQSMLQLQIARQYPDIQLGPGYEYDQGDNKWSLGLSISLPGNRNRGQIAEARAQREEIAARFNALQAGVLKQIDIAFAAYHAAARKQADASAMLAEQTRQEAVAQGMYEAGAISASDLAALRIELSVSALSRLNALLEAQQAVGQLNDAVQSPFGLPGAVWEQLLRASEASAEGGGP